MAFHGSFSSSNQDCFDGGNVRLSVLFQIIPVAAEDYARRAGAKVLHGKERRLLQFWHVHTFCSRVRGPFANLK